MSNNTQIFYSCKDSQMWFKPPSARLIHIICIGAGGGGGGGASAAINTARGGGGGGGSAGITRMTIDAFFCPDYLTCYVPNGGLGGEAGLVGGFGERAFVLTPIINGVGYTGTILLQSGNGYAGGGGAGTSAVGGPAGVGSTGVVSSTYGPLGVFTSIAGEAGKLGGYSTTATIAQTWGSLSLFISGGAGGAGVSTAAGYVGGNITQGVNPLFQTITGGAIGGGRGKDGVDGFKPLFSTGGSGGGSSNTGTGGAGGNGGYGSGGAGGGAGVTGGKGGDGGDGLVIISWT